MAEINYLVDKLVAEITAKVEALDYIDKCYGKVQILSQKKDNREFVYPAIYTGNGQYISMFPDASLGNYGFVVVKEPYIYQEYSKNKVNRLKTEFAIVLWYDARKVSNDDSNSCELVKSELSYILTKGTFKFGSVILRSITEDRKRIFEEFTSREVEEQYFMWPYRGIRIDGNLLFNEECTVNGVVIPPTDPSIYETLIKSGTEAYILAAQADEKAQQALEQIANIPTSDNNLTDTLKQNYDSAYLHSQSTHAPINAQKNVQSDWNQADNTQDDFIKNKPTAPEFSNVTIPALNTTAESNGEIPTTLWSFIQSVYSEIVAKSVKSHIIGLWQSLKNQNRIIRDITIDQEVASLTINTDSDGNAFEVKEGETLRIVAYFPSYAPAGATNYLYLRLNEITTNIYASSIFLGSYFRQTLGDNQATFIAELEVINGFIHLNWFVQRNVNGVFATSNVNGFTTESLGSITSIYLLVVGSAKIRTGSRIKVKHIKSNS